jgi:nucleotide-binding universal stress UspA family protein
MDRILLAFNGSPDAWHALDTVARLAAAGHEEVGVIHVVDGRPGERIAEPTEALLAARDALAARGIHASLHAVGGVPAEQIQLLADAGGYDTIVLGASPSGPIARLLRGSTSADVAANAPVTVVVARRD